MKQHLLLITEQFTSRSQVNTVEAHTSQVNCLPKLAPGRDASE